MTEAPDGSPVSLYLALPGGAEAQFIHEAIPASADVLELGCGAGRVTRHLVELGHAVTAVDNSPEMLAAFPDVSGVERVLAEIVSLKLDRRFRAVLLASHMINGRDGPAFLGTAARHVADDGVVLVQRHEPGWVDGARPVVSERDGITFELIDIVHRAPGVVSACALYTVGGVAHRQPFTAYEVDDDRLASLTERVGLQADGCVANDPAWVKLTPSHRTAHGS